MPSVGPQLPPELQKRKRTDDKDNESDSSDSSTGPLPPSGPGTEEPHLSAKRARVIGPTLPPAPLDERPAAAPTESPEGQSSSDDDDDDFGPSLPSSKDVAFNSSIGPRAPAVTVAAPPAQRDEWMTLAPSSGDWSSRVDPTKLKNRKFNTGRGAKAPPSASSGGGGTDSSWHETPEEKQARLKREVMGIKDDTPARRSGTTGQGKDAVDEATARRLKEYNENQRGPSLYAAHSASQSESLDDDPSARAFDREKDIGGNSNITATQRRDMVKKASDFSSRFSKAKYL